jgi:hypothetical protein
MALQFGGDGVKLLVKLPHFNAPFNVNQLIRSSTKGGGNASRLSGVVVPTWPVVEDGIDHGLSSG